MDKKDDNKSSKTASAPGLSASVKNANTTPKGVSVSIKSVTNTENKTNASKKAIKKILINSVITITCICLLIFFFKNRSGQIVGFVIDSSSNTPLSGILITMDENKSFESNNVSGGFLIQDIKPGEHTLKFKGKGFEEQTIKVKIKSGQKIEQKVILFTEEQQVNINDYEVFVANSGSDSISAINLKNKHLSKSISVGKTPNSIISIKNKYKIYTANIGDDSISIVSLNSFQEIKRIQLERLSGPFKLAVSPANDKLYILNKNKPLISIINTNDDIMFESVINLQQSAKDLKIDPASGNIIVYSNNSISILSNSGNLINTFRVNNATGENMFFSSQKNSIFLNGRGNIIQVNISTGETKLYPVNTTPSALVVNNNNLYSAFSNSITIIDISNGNIKKENIFSGGKQINQLKLSSDGSRIYISHYDSNNISIFDCNTEEILPELISVGSKPKSLDGI